MIPGGNLLVQALTLISSQTVRYFAYTGRTTTITGREVSAFASGVDHTLGSAQAVPRSRYAELGLDWSRSYVSWFVPASVLGVERDRSGDEFQYIGRRYKVQSVTPWMSQDGWNEVRGVDIGLEPFPELFPGYLAPPLFPLPTGVTAYPSGLVFAAVDASLFVMYSALFSIQANGEYDVTFTLSNLTAGGARLTLYGANQNAMTQTRIANGTYVERITLSGEIPAAPENAIIVQASTDPINSFSVSGVSVRAAQ